jgi:hypothetical protein
MGEVLPCEFCLPGLAHESRPEAVGVGGIYPGEANDGFGWPEFAPPVFEKA